MKFLSQVLVLLPVPESALRLNYAPINIFPQRGGGGAEIPWGLDSRIIPTPGN